MSRIQILPEQLANQIAAGEVIERPASVVRECIDNALDAGATEIMVHIQDGGCRSIRVMDNGCGMDEDDLLLCLERHATSKLSPSLRTIEPGVINTLGFRGEAISSIASVSKMTLISRLPTASLGTEAHVSFGRLIKVHDCGAAVGTGIEVSGLFGNLPARRKFLKSPRTEEAHVQETVIRAALANPAVSFVLENEQKSLLRLLLKDGLEQRCRTVFKARHSLGLLSVDHTLDAGSVSGFLMPPDALPASHGKIRLFVNQRPVQDRMLVAAVHQGLKTFLPPGRQPVAALFLKLAPEEVDINVHPAKREVRFRKPSAVKKLVEEGVRNAVIAFQQKLKEALFTVPDPRPPDKAPIASQTTPEMAPSSWLTPTTREPAQPCYNSDPLPGASAWQPSAPGNPLLEERSSEKTAAAGPRLLGQLHDLYLLFENDSGLLVIDQHAAHERLLFEQLKKAVTENAVESQELLYPVVVELEAREKDAADKHAEDLRRLGIIIEPFGENSFTLRAVPVLLRHMAVQEILAEVLQGFIPTSDKSHGIENAFNRVLATMACRAAVKAGDRMSDSEIRSLVDSVVQNPVFSNCPHGRPVIRQITMEELEKWFHRRP